MNARFNGVPLIVFTDADRGSPRCINGLHIQTFVPNSVGDRKGTLITFTSGDTVTITDDFQAVANSFMADRLDG